MSNASNIQSPETADERERIELVKNDKTEKVDDVKIDSYWAKHHHVQKTAQKSSQTFRRIGMQHATIVLLERQSNPGELTGLLLPAMSRSLLIFQYTRQLGIQSFKLLTQCLSHPLH